MASNKPSSEFIRKCKEDFKKRVERAIRTICCREDNLPNNTLIPQNALDEFVDNFEFEYNEKDSEYSVSALPTVGAIIIGLGRFSKGFFGGGAGGAGLGAVGGAGAGAGIGAMIGIVGGPIGVGIGAGIGAGAGAAMGVVAGAVPGAGFGAWAAKKFLRNIHISWRKIHKQLTNQGGNSDNSKKLKATFKLQLDASS